MKHFAISILIILLLSVVPGCSKAGGTSDSTEVVPGIPVKNTVTLVDLGATTCVPCRMMAPILEELKVEYKDRAEVIFIDVWNEDNKNKARVFKVLSIPTQVFFNKQGTEVFRHVGFFGKDEIVAKLDELLAE